MALSYSYEVPPSSWVLLDVNLNLRKKFEAGELRHACCFSVWRFIFFFYSNEGSPREPIHVQVRKAGGEAKFWLSRHAVASSQGFDARTLRELLKLVDETSFLIERTWHEYFA